MSVNPVENNEERLCPYLKRYWAYRYSGDKMYMTNMEAAEVIKEEMQPCIKDKCIFYFKEMNACRKN